MWLAAFAALPKPAREAIDLGCGVGAVGLSLLFSGAADRAAFVDLDEELVGLARANAERAALSDRARFVRADVREPLPQDLVSTFDLVVANPPWARASSPASSDVRRARARTADDATARGFARATRAALARSGRACFVVPGEELAFWMSLLRSVGLEPKRMRAVHPLPDAPARSILLEAKPGRPGGLRVEPPLVAMSSPGAWSAEAARILDGELRHM